MKNRKCYIDEIMIVDSTWTYDQTTAKLAEWFPQISKYIHDNELHLQTAANGKVVPWWRLLVKTGYQLGVVEAVYPTGADLLKNKGRDKAGVSDSQLWFGTLNFFLHYCQCADLGCNVLVTRNRIPDDIYESWNTQPVIAGSDSEDDEMFKIEDNCSEGGDTDVDPACISDDEFDKPLASSVGNLSLFGPLSTQANTNAKGKGRCTIPRTPQKSGQH